MWDFSGRNDTCRIRAEFYEELHAIVYVFDLNSLKSFSNVEDWIKECKKLKGDKMLPVLVGNKKDLKREVSATAIDNLASKYKFNYFEVSAKTGDGIKNFFYDFASYLYELLPKDKKK
jgi:small GTP-binding protein